MGYDPRSHGMFTEQGSQGFSAPQVANPFQQRPAAPGSPIGGGSVNPGFPSPQLPQQGMNIFDPSQVQRPIGDAFAQFGNAPQPSYGGPPGQFGDFEALRGGPPTFSNDKHPDNFHSLFDPSQMPGAGTQPMPPPLEPQQMSAPQQGTGPSFRSAGSGGFYQAPWQGGQ